MVGGSVPGLLLHDAAEPHVGTLDIDLTEEFSYDSKRRRI